MNIRELRIKRGLSQDKLAAVLGVAPFTIRRWESGKSTPSPLAQEKLDRLFNDVAGADATPPQKKNN